MKTPPPNDYWDLDEGIEYLRKIMVYATDQHRLLVEICQTWQTVDGDLWRQLPDEFVTTMFRLQDRYGHNETIEWIRRVVEVKP